MKKVLSTKQNIFNPITILFSITAISLLLLLIKEWTQQSDTPQMNTDLASSTANAVTCANVTEPIAVTTTALIGVLYQNLLPQTCAQSSACHPRTAKTKTSTKKGPNFKGKIKAVVSGVNPQENGSVMTLDPESPTMKFRINSKYHPLKDIDFQLQNPNHIKPQAELASAFVGKLPKSGIVLINERHGTPQSTVLKNGLMFLAAENRLPAHVEVYNEGYPIEKSALQTRVKEVVPKLKELAPNYHGIEHTNLESLYHLLSVRQRLIEGPGIILDCINEIFQAYQFNPHFKTALNKLAKTDTWAGKILKLFKHENKEKRIKPKIIKTIKKALTSNIKAFDKTMQSLLNRVTEDTASEHPYIAQLNKPGGLLSNLCKAKILKKDANPTLKQMHEFNKYNDAIGKVRLLYPTYLTAQQVCTPGSEDTLKVVIYGDYHTNPFIKFCNQILGTNYTELRDAHGNTIPSITEFQTPTTAHTEL